MYKGWQLTRWETPVSDRDRILLVSLTDANRVLTLVFEDPGAEGRPRWSVRFEGYPAYRNIDERYRLDLWRWLTESDQRCGSTFVVDESPRFESWHTGYLESMEPETRHFVIATNDDVVEILSAIEPIWTEIEPASPQDPPPGKSEHFYAGEDDEAMDRIMEDLLRRNRTH